jgi:large subunit ribosomal protein L3
MASRVVAPRTAPRGSTVRPGSIGAGTNPSRVIKGKRMPGHMGDVQQTVRNLKVAKVDTERNLIYLRGAVPGPVNGYVFITTQ